MNDTCLFCKIAANQIPAKEVLRTEHVVAFHDLNPQAPVHVLVIPTSHAEHLSAFAGSAGDAAAAAFVRAVAQVGGMLGAAGYRVVMNEGRDGGQTVGHLHAHVLAGRQMHWPPG